MEKIDTDLSKYVLSHIISAKGTSMAISYEELMADVRSAWAADTWAVHAAASSAFRAEVEEYQAIGAVLARARATLKLTQPVLSQLTGIQQAEISRIESGSANPTAATLFKLTGALGLKVVIEPR
jgi:DNA-binding XRE family transcriptional regulator